MNRRTLWSLVVTALAIVGVWLWSARKPVEDHPSEHALPMPPPSAPAHPIAAPEPPREAAAGASAPSAEPLPPLAESDFAVSARLVELLGVEGIPDWLITEQFVSRVVATVDSLTSRQLAPRVLPLRPPPGAFRVSGAEGAWSKAPGNDERYEAYLALMASVDTAAAVRLYRRHYPWFQESYEALGYPGGYFNDRLVEVIDHLLATPEPASAPVLLRPEAVYVFADKSLESLSAGQKLLLRLGPGQRQAVRAWLTAFRAGVAAE